MYTLSYNTLKRFIVLFAVVFIASISAKAQKYYTKNGNISFFSKTSLEDIKADNNQVVSVLNTQTGELQFSLIVKNFHFRKALMEEHFNENYVESEKFPKSTFKGTIADISKVNFSADGTYNVSVTGDLSLHGVTQKVSTPGTITVKGGKINASAKFQAKPSDFNITIPSLVKEKIAEMIDVAVDCDYDQKM